MSHSVEEVKKQVQTYVRVFITLAILTIVTVGVSYIEMPVMLGVVVALFIALIKSSLVAAFFMHLASERKLIYAILGLTVAFFFVLLLWPSWHSY